MNGAPQPTLDPAALLEQLRDLGIPEPAPWWPPAPGWWGVAILLVAVVFLLARSVARRRRDARHLKEAQALLDRLHVEWSSTRDDRAFASGVQRLLRRVAIHQAGRETIARLTGSAFLEQINTLSATPLTPETGNALIEASYRPSAAVDVERLRREVEVWLQQLRSRRHA